MEKQEFYSYWNCCEFRSQKINAQSEINSLPKIKMTLPRISLKKIEEIELQIA